MATLIAGANNTTSDELDGKTVEDVRCDFRGVLNIAASAVATVNGRPVQGDYVLQSGDSLVFNKPTGEKGARA